MDRQNTAGAKDAGAGLPPPAPLRERARVYAAMLVAAALIVVVVALIVVNADSVRLDWVFGSTDAPLALVILMAAVAGWLVGLASAHILRRRARRRR